MAAGVPGHVEVEQVGVEPTNPVGFSLEMRARLTQSARDCYVPSAIPWWL